MRDITKLMIIKYQLLELKYDFMGYPFNKERELSFHHLIVPHRLCKLQNIENDGYVEWNGAILKQSTSHNYLHIIERYEREMFDEITRYMVIENKQGYIDDKILYEIDDILCSFEKEHSNDTTKNGKKLVRKEFKNRVMR